MSALLDTSILIDVLRGREAALTLLANTRAEGELHASEITRLEVLAGMRPDERARTYSLFAALVWHPVDEQIAERAGALGREWHPSHPGLESADLAIAATALHIDARLVSGNVKHFPMFPDLAAPY